MLTALRIGNFKAFAETQRIPIRPLTLIYGANSSGKSSVLHSVILARHAFETGDLDVQRTAIGGESVDLGGFRQYIHRRDYGRQMEWAVELDASAFPGRLAELCAPVSGVNVRITVGIELDTLGTPVAGSKPRVRTYDLQADNKDLLRISSRDAGSLKLDRLDHHHPLFRGILKAIVDAATTTTSLTNEDYSALSEAIDGLIPELHVTAGGFLPAGVSLKGQSRDSAADLLVAISRGSRRNDLANAVRLYFPRILNELVQGISSQTQADVDRLLYLGPLRSYPPRHIAFSQHHDPNWQAGGGSAWDIVRRDKAIRESVNRWLSNAERMQTPYSLEIQELVDLDDLSHPIYMYLELISNKDSSTSEGETDTPDAGPEGKDNEMEAYLLQEYIRGTEIDRINELVLRDQLTNTLVSHRDVGIGVSQVLPVLVHAYACQSQLIAIEQPEIHLHPALQAELGDVFIESALGGSNNSFLLETHSEHLLLRVLRRIRETTEGALPEGLQPIRPEQVAVLYIQPGSKGAEVIEIPVTPDGEFARAWPRGFFAERARELF